MGQNLEQVLDQMRQIGVGAQVGVTLTTNQDNGIASFADGLLSYFPSSLIGPLLRPERLSTSGATPLKYYFSDRRLDIDPPPSPGSFPNTPRQPFSANATDKLGMSIAQGPLRIATSTPVVKFTLITWGNATFNVSMERKGNLLVGLGPPVGNGTDHAVYVVAFGGVIRQPH